MYIKNKKKYSVLIVEKAELEGATEKIRLFLPIIKRKQEYNIFLEDAELLNVQPSYVAVLLEGPEDFPVAERVAEEVPFLFFREEGSSFILAKKAKEETAKKVIELLCKRHDGGGEVLIYHLSTDKERLGYMLNAAKSFFDSQDNLMVGRKKIKDIAQDLFNSYFSREVRESTTYERYTINPALNIDLTKHSLCFFE